jgi:ankyrin repeat protein
MEVHMSKQLPKQPSLEHLKNEAKALLRLAKTGDPDAQQQVGDAKLATAQLAIARGYGFASWSKLKRYVEGFADYREAFFAGLRAGDRERVRQLLSESPALVNTNDPNDFGTAPISVAANRGDRPMIDLLLENGANIDARSDWWAGSFGALDFADEGTSKYLLSKGATLTAHAASRLGMARELKAIIARRPEAVHERGGDGQYPLHFAKTQEIVDILLDAGADIEARDIDHEGTPLQNRILEHEVRQRLFERGAKTDIFSAIVLDQLDLVKKHLQEDPGALERRVDEGANPMIPKAPGRHIYNYNIGSVRPYQVAANLGRDKIFDYLFEISSPNLKLLSAVWKGDRELTRKVLGENPELISRLTRKDKEVLPETVRGAAKPETVALMLESGFDVNTADHEMMSAAHWASFHGRDDLIEIILPYKPNLEAKNVYGGTVLRTGLYGSQNGWYKDNNFARSTELLIQAGSQLPEKAYGSPEVVEVLKRYGVAGE